jgi:Mn2+/Fe2+ NRAMP family transporter
VGGAVALLVANTLNVGADLAGMADAAELLTGLNSHGWVFVFGVGIAFGTIQLRYLTIERVLRWLALVLFAYVVTGLILRPDWGTVLRAAVTPTVPSGRAGWMTLVAILGTTISPYLFFWQASQEVEEEKAKGRNTLARRRGATPKEIQDRNLDVGAGTFFSNVVMFFIMLTTSLTLHRHGLTNLQTSRDVAEALEPLAGRFSMLLYTVGLVGTGLLAIPTLTGSAAYAFAETFGWREGIDRQPRQAPGFYLVVGLATLAGITMDFANVNPVRALFWTAVINGVLAPVLLFGILLVASDHRAMNGQALGLLPRVVVGVAAVLMTGAAAGFLFL